ncbi:MAG: methyltransferase domain-containing protein [Deltaproteobacteria bacterium]|nr:methyltransferase domain-containing protein [Deltaproteobacteria bacterium]
MDVSYFSHVRREIAPLLSGTYHTGLEVGCGAGVTLEWLQSSGICTNTIGVEYDPLAALEAGNRVNKVYCGDIGSIDLDIPPESVDLLLCLDVLEHLPDPWAVMKNLYRLVRPGGSVVVSLPNVRYWKVSAPLLFSDKWQYTDAGVLDRTHLRFFVKQTAIEMVEQGGFTVEKVISTGLGRSKRSQFVNGLLPDFIINLLSYQFVIKGTKLVS